MSKVHVIPQNDLISHRTEVDDECVCGPTSEPVESEDGSMNWLIIHHSLDGREKEEDWKEKAADLAREWLKEEEDEE